MQRIQFAADPTNEHPDPEKQTRIDRNAELVSVSVAKTGTSHIDENGNVVEHVKARSTTNPTREAGQLRQLQRAAENAEWNLRQMEDKDGNPLPVFHGRYQATQKRLAAIKEEGLELHRRAAAAGVQDTEEAPAVTDTGNVEGVATSLEEIAAGDPDDHVTKKAKAQLERMGRIRYRY